MKLLVAEDEPKTGAYLQQGLSEAGFNGPGYDRYAPQEKTTQSMLESYHLLNSMCIERVYSHPCQPPVTLTSAPPT